MTMKIITTSISKPPKICIFGKPGVGKSRFAASFPAPFFIRSEDRHDHLSIQTHEGVLASYENLLEVLDWLLTEKHVFKTVVLDTADSAEKLVHDKVCRDCGADNILDPRKLPFYAGFVRAASLWETQILYRLARLNEEKKIMPVIISHLETKYETHPQYGDFPKFVLGVDKRTAAKIYKLCDIVGFLDWRTSTKGEEGAFRLSSSNQRILRLKPRAFWETKESYNLPEEIEIPEDGPGELMGYGVLRAAIAAGLKARVHGNLGEVKADSETKKLTEPKGDNVGEAK